MCGIAGIFSLDKRQPIDGATRAAMASTLRHRGPDDEGSFTAPGVALGFTRLSIVDLATGNQPHSDESGDIVSVCNGEIYNHRELRRELEAAGHRLPLALRCRGAGAPLRRAWAGAGGAAQWSVRLRDP